MSFSYENQSVTKSALFCIQHTWSVVTRWNNTGRADVSERNMQRVSIELRISPVVARTKKNATTTAVGRVNILNAADEITKGEINPAFDQNFPALHEKLEQPPRKRPHGDTENRKFKLGRCAADGLERVSSISKTKTDLRTLSVLLLSRHCSFDSRDVMTGKLRFHAEISIILLRGGATQPCRRSIWLWRQN